MVKFDWPDARRKCQPPPSPSEWIPRASESSTTGLADLQVCFDGRSHRESLQVFLEDRPVASWQVVAARASSIHTRRRAGSVHASRSARRQQSYPGPETINSIIVK